VGGSGLTVSFDLDGTLTDLAFADGVWEEGVPALVSERLGIGFEKARSMCRKAYELEGDASTLWYRLEHWLERFGIDDVDPEELVDRYTGRIRAYEDGLRALETLRSEGVNLVLFSNASRTFLAREIHHAAIGQFFDLVVSLPDDWGMVKAQSEAFSRLARHVATRVVHVGDHVLYDYEVPRRAGVTAYHVWRGRGEHLPDSLETLDRLVDRISRELRHP